MKNAAFAICLCCLAASLALPLPAAAELAAPADSLAVRDAAPERVPVDSFTLANGMTFLLIERPEMVTVSAGWAARVGAVDDPPEASGLAHFLEHMLFKGSRTIGARDLDRELALQREQDELVAAIRQLRADGRDGRRLRRLEEELGEVIERSKALANPGELSALYAQAGARGLNALTLDDMTLYFVTLPAGKLELWFWLESDRLLEPMFRDLYTERSVVEEERSRRMASPTGRLDEQLQELFWGDHPYGRPNLGRPEHLAALSREQVHRHFAATYPPGNLTVALVGRFDPARVRRLAERYFGRLEAPSADSQTAGSPGAGSPAAGSPAAGSPTASTTSASQPGQLADTGQRRQRRMEGECSCRPQVQLLYRTVPFGHPDAPALEVLAGLLNGRTGRLHRSLVMDKQVAFSAFALHNPMRQAGVFSFQGELKEGREHRDLLAAWDRELERLIAEPIAAAELTKVKNQITADAYRRLDDPSALMMQLLIYDALGDWEHVNSWAGRTLAVTADQLREVAARYLVPQRRTIGVYRTAGQASGR